MEEGGWISTSSSLSVARSLGLRPRSVGAGGNESEEELCVCDVLKNLLELAWTPDRPRREHSC